MTPDIRQELLLSCSLFCFIIKNWELFCDTAGEKNYTSLLVPFLETKQEKANFNSAPNAPSQSNRPCIAIFSIWVDDRNPLTMWEVQSKDF